MSRNLKERPITNDEARDIIDYYKYKNLLEDGEERLLYEDTIFFTNGMKNIKSRLLNVGIHVN